MDNTNSTNLSALHGTGTIQTYGELLNAQVDGVTGADTTGLINPEVFYSTILLDTIREAADSYQYYKYAKPMPIEGKADKLVVRRWSPLQAHTVPLQEGVPPVSDKGSVEKYEINAFQYGRYMEFTDRVDFKAVDPIVSHYTAEYSIVAVETLDLLARDMLLTCAQQYFAGGKANMAAMDFTATPAIADLRLIGLAFKNAKVKPVDNTYHVLVSPEFVYDMLDDPYVQNYMRINQTTGNFYEDGTLIPMFGFSFHEVVNCPTSSAWYDAEAQAWKCLEYNTTTNAVAVVTTSNVESGYVLDSRTGKDASYIPNRRIFTPSAGCAIMKVNHIIILGQDALCRTGLSGEDAAKMYVKPLGSAGVLDPIEQRQSIGFKINSVGFGSTRLEAIVDYICVPTQLNV